MGWQGKRAAALAMPVAALALGLGACGGKDSSNESASSTDPATTAATGETGPTGTTGTTSVGGVTGATGSAPSGGSKAPSTDSSSPKGSDKSSGKRAPKKKKQQVDPDKPSAGELANLYTQARQVCKVLTLQGLAHEYEVAETPSAVAKAYSKAYPAAQRAAVYNGCKSGLS